MQSDQQPEKGRGRQDKVIRNRIYAALRQQGSTQPHLQRQLMFLKGLFIYKTVSNITSYSTDHKIALIFFIIVHFQSS